MTRSTSTGGRPASCIGLRGVPILARAFPLLAVVFTGCYDPPPPGPPSVPVGREEAFRRAFEADVYPILLRDCGFPACHGSDDRFFQVYGPGRARLDGAALRADVEAAELDRSFERARSMLAAADTAEQSLLVRKPLAVGAGGAPHMGLDALGQDLYSSPEEAGYQALLDWARMGLSE